MLSRLTLGVNVARVCNMVLLKNRDCHKYIYKIISWYKKAHFQIIHRGKNSPIKF